MKAVMLAITLVAALGGSSACAAEPDQRAGGPTTAQTVQLTPRPSWRPLGPGVRTGVVVGDTELVVYFWAGGDGSGRPYLDSTWLRRQTSEFVDWPVQRDGTPVAQRGGGTAQVGESAFLGIYQYGFVGYPLVEWGAIRARPSSIVVESGGRSTPASLTPWPYDESVTVFWSQRPGEPIPTDTPAGEGVWSPLPPENYPLVTAYDAGGRVIASVRLRGSRSAQRE